MISKPRLNDRNLVERNMLRPTMLGYVVLRAHCDRLDRALDYYVETKQYQTYENEFLGLYDALEGVKQEVCTFIR